jgi:DNA-binding NarL/FixJ family response regulator
VQQAHAIYIESLILNRDVGDKPHSALLLRNLSHVALSLGQDECAVQLYAAAEIWDSASGGVFRTLIDHAEQEQEVESLRARMGEEAFALNWAKGQAMTLDDAIAYASAIEAPEAAPSHGKAPFVAPSPSTYPADLTVREVEVLRLLAQGLTYAQIAEKLVISHRTVNTHLTTIYGKIGVTSRAAATRFAHEHHLV